MSLDHEEAAGNWVLHINGSFAGEGAAVASMSLFGTDASGTMLSEVPLDMGPDGSLPTASPFEQTLQIQSPDPDWVETGVRLQIATSDRSVEVRSSIFPIIWRHPVLIDHAITGTIVEASNYIHGGIPEGIGIPHTLINGLPQGDYYAVVFFDGLHGCPSNNYEINSFQANGYWGYDTRGPNAPYAKAFSSAGGGCMQKFHVDPTKGDDWLWGALSNTGTSSAIADANRVPAFAICATAAACDPIIPHTATTAPEDTPASRHLVSNVLFLPGIKGSKLYEDNPLCLIPSDSCGIPLWLPIADAAVPQLFLDADGKSERSIFAREGSVIESAFGQDFYASFMHIFDQARTDGTFGTGWNWKTIAYDWRLSLPDIIQGGALRGDHIYFGESTSTPYIEQELRSLASSSPTKKVTIIAHSNGGLVAKALLASLGDTLAAQLVDAVIFVGVPQSGAPRALGALLYGDEEGIPGIPHMPDFIMSAAHAREFGLHSPMAYHLLPSETYFAAKQPTHPVVQFDGNTLLSNVLAAYGSTIDTEQELQSFARAEFGDRSMPAQNDLTSANVLSAGLLTYASGEHAALDTWQPPSGIEAYQLGGYGVPTISGIDMYEAAHANGSSTLSYRPLFTQDGDGTVPIISALMMNVSAHVHQLWLDLPSMKRAALAYSHGNIFESEDVQETLKDILLGSAAFPATVHAMDLAALPSPKKQLAFYVHSQVSLVITDAHGIEAGVSDDTSRQDIPGSVAGMLGEVKYVVVPADDAPYTLSLSGEARGTFTLDIQESNGDNVTASSTIADVPVSKSSRATLTIGNSISSASALAVDEDGDYATDFSVQPVLGATVFPTASTTHNTSASKASMIRHSLPPASASPTQRSVPGVPTQTAPVASSSAQHFHSLNTPTKVVINLEATQDAAIQHAVTAQRPSLLKRFLAMVREIIRALLYPIKIAVGRRES